ncbi:MAG TPA: hypothetical protein VHO24_08795 [Opitutaceae bacterium]|nr:hypothetical protein [Opitutaceae bacterium]
MSASVPECPKCHRVFVPAPGSADPTLCADCNLPDAETVHRQRERREKKRSRRVFHPWRAEGVGNMQDGGVIFVIGALITFCTYAFADVAGGYFLLAWGPVLFGFLRVLYGLFQYLF